MITERNVKQAKRYCKDDYRKIPGYERALKEPGRFDIHHVLELTLDGQYARSREELMRLGMYYNRPYFELRWLSHCDHMSLHVSANPPMLGRTGEKAPLYGKGYLISGEKSSNWKGDSVGPQGAYRRAKKLYKAGTMSEEEFQTYRDACVEYQKERRQYRKEHPKK